MSVALSKIDPGLTLEKLQISTENQYFERKSSRIKDKDIAHQLSAMANASGGIIAIGVENDGEITGIDETRENELRNIPFEFLQKIPQHEIEIVSVANTARVFLFHVSPMPDEIIRCTDGEAYLRVGDRSRKLSTEELLELEYSKGIRSYESQVIKDAALEDLDRGLIEEYCRLLELNVSTPLDILKSRGLIKKNGDNWDITVAAILLFGKIPTQFLPSARVRFLRYEGTVAEVGTDMNLVKDITIEKPLHHLITEGQRLIASQMR